MVGTGLSILPSISLGLRLGKNPRKALAGRGTEMGLTGGPGSEALRAPHSAVI